jgi:hypothetical protein
VAIEERKDCIACDSDAVSRDMAQLWNTAAARSEYILYGHSTSFTNFM